MTYLVISPTNNNIFFIGIINSSVKICGTSTVEIISRLMWLMNMKLTYYYYYHMEIPLTMYQMIPPSCCFYMRCYVEGKNIRFQNLI